MNNKIQDGQSNLRYRFNNNFMTMKESKSSLKKNEEMKGASTICYDKVMQDALK